MSIACWVRWMIKQNSFANLDDYESVSMLNRSVIVPSTVAANMNKG